MNEMSDSAVSCEDMAGHGGQSVKQVHSRPRFTAFVTPDPFETGRFESGQKYCWMLNHEELANFALH